MMTTVPVHHTEAGTGYKIRNRMKEVNQSSSQPTSDGLGSLLRREREAQGLTLESLAQKTRIQRSHLDAIEREDWRMLPAGPFVKGFVTSYAKALGVRPETVLPMLPDVDNVPNAHAMALAANERRAADLELRELPVGGRPRSSGVWIALGGVVLLVVVGGVLWQREDVRTALSFDKLMSLSERVSGPDATRSPATAPASGAAKPAAVSPSTATATARKPEADGSTGGTADKTDAKSASGSTAPAGGAGTPKDGASTSAVAGLGSLQRLAAFVSETDQQQYDVYSDAANKSATQTVTVSARYKVYVKVLANPSDLKPVFEGLLLESEKKTFSAPGDLWMVVGNAAAVNLTYNGQPLGSLGRDGEKKGLGFRLSTRE